MKRGLVIAVLILIIAFIAFSINGCAKIEEVPNLENESSENESNQNASVITNTNPMDILSNSMIQKWGADCKDKTTDLEKANCILEWQEKNIFWCYTHPEENTMPFMFEAGYPDCVVDMQFQQMKSGSFPVSKIMELKTRNNKLFGACYTYATTYCAVARWNGLTCRVMWARTVGQTFYAASGDYAQGYCGAAQKSWLDALGLDCDEWRTLDWKMDAGHYWAEVLINGEWQIMEKQLWAYMHDTQKNIKDVMAYEDTKW